MNSEFFLCLDRLPPKTIKPNLSYYLSIVGKFWIQSFLLLGWLPSKAIEPRVLEFDWFLILSCNPLYHAYIIYIYTHTLTNDNTHSETRSSDLNWVSFAWCHWLGLLLYLCQFRHWALWIIMPGSVCLLVYLLLLVMFYFYFFCWLFFFFAGFFVGFQYFLLLLQFFFFHLAGFVLVKLKLKV